MLRRRPALRPLTLVALTGAVAVLVLARLGAASAATANVAVTDNAFTAGTVTITAGDTVVWTDSGALPHTVTADDNSFDSGNMSTGQTFSRTFTTPGTIRYYCKIHGAAGGVGMSGTIVVQAAQVTTTTTTAAPTTTTAAPATTTTGAAADTATTVATTATTQPAAVLAATAERSTAAAAAQPAALASTGSGPYTAAVAAIGLALLLTGAVVLRQVRRGERAHVTDGVS